MKRKAERAFVEDVDPNTDEIIKGSRVSASIFLPMENSRARRNARRSLPDQIEVQDRESHESRGLIRDIISKHTGETGLLTILAGKHDDNAIVWRNLGNTPQNHRVFYFTDLIVNRESGTHIEREIIVSKGQDLAHSYPSIIIAQRVLDSFGAVQLHAHELSFGSSVDLDRIYIFPRLGDEIPSIGRPDLHCTFRAVQDWGQYEKSSTFANFDRNICVEVSVDAVKENRRVVYDFASDCVVQRDEYVAKPTFGIALDAGDLAPLLLRPEKKDLNSGNPNTGPRAQNTGAKRESAVKQAPKRLCISVIGAGPEVKEHSFKADINVEFVLVA